MSMNNKLISGKQDTAQIEIRYSELAKDDQCCLSCGGAIDYSKPQKGEICADLGSGRGSDVIRMAEEVGETGFAFGIDISDGMLKKAQKNADKLRVQNVKFIKSTLEEIELPDETVNLVISNCTINHARDKFKTWSEINRILKKGGRFVVSDIYSSEEVPEEYRNDPVAVAECWAGATTKDDYLETLQKVGFKNIDIIEESAPYEKGKIMVSSFTITGTKKCCN